MLLFLLHPQLKTCFQMFGAGPFWEGKGLPQLHSLHYCTWVLRMKKKKLGLKLALKDSIFLTFTSAGCKQVSGKLNNRDKTNTSNAHSAAEPKENSLSWERLWLCPPAVCPISLLKVSILASCKNSSAAWSLSKAGNELRQHKQVPTTG